jgi:hypothetical protein
MMNRRGTHTITHKYYRRLVLYYVQKARKNLAASRRMQRMYEEQRAQWVLANDECMELREQWLHPATSSAEADAEYAAALRRHGGKG